jgi:hypothetical protein
MSLLNLSDNIDFPGSNLILTDSMTFPSNPKNGEFAFVDGALHIYGSVDNVITWYPLTSKQQYWIHVQDLPASDWSVQHNLGTKDLLFMAYDENSLLAYSGYSIPDENNIQLSFPEDTVGTVVIFASSEARLSIIAQTVDNLENSMDLFSSEFAAISESVNSPTWNLISGDHTVSEMIERLIVQSTSTITLPSTPSSGQTVYIAQGSNWESNPATIYLNNKPLNGESYDNLELEYNQSITLVYTTPDIGWTIL